MISQQMTARLQDMSGSITITASPGSLQELQDLAAELAERPGMITNGTITYLAPLPPPPPEG